MFTTADNYVVQIHLPLDEPLRSLVVAAAVSVDTALKQDSRGLSSIAADPCGPRPNSGRLADGNGVGR